MSCKKHNNKFIQSCPVFEGFECCACCKQSNICKYSLFKNIE